MAGPQTLAIDRIACDGAGLCAELLPELISLDDWGYPMLVNGPVPAELQGFARRAVDACPVLALRLRAALPPVDRARTFPASRVAATVAAALTATRR